MPVFEIQYSKTYVFLCTDAVEASDAEAAIEEIQSNSRDYEDGVLEESFVEINSSTEFVPSQTVWVVLVTDGTLIAFAPEIYTSEAIAKREAVRWASNLAADVFDVRLVRASAGMPIQSVAWVGTYWTRYGFPDPEAALFPDRDSARSWAIRSEGAGEPIRIDMDETSLSATFVFRGEEEYAVAHLAKLVR